MMHHAAFLLGLHYLPNYMFKCEKWCKARRINPWFHTMCLKAATALTRLRICAGSSDHSLLVDGIIPTFQTLCVKEL